MANFGERIKMLREERLETQDFIARLFKISRATVSKYESNDREPDISTIKSLARHFGVSIDYLFGESEIRNMPEFIAENIRLIKGVLSDEEFSKLLSELFEMHIDKEEINSYITNTHTPTASVLNVIADYAGVDVGFFYKKNTLEELDKMKNEKVHEGSAIYQLSDVEGLLRDKNFVNLAIKIKENNLSLDIIDKMVNCIIEIKVS